MAVFGYARVSTNGQTLAAQDAELRAAGAAKVYAEKISGAVTDRPELGKLIQRLEPGDTLMVTRLDRLARSTRDLLNIVERISEAGAGFKSLADSWADTTTPHGKLMLTILGGLAEFERSLIRARTGEGRKRAQAAGVRFGRPHKMTAHQRAEAIERLRNGAYTVRCSAVLCGQRCYDLSLGQLGGWHKEIHPGPRQKRFQGPQSHGDRRLAEYAQMIIILGQAHDAIVGNVAEKHVAPSREVDRALGPAEPGRDALNRHGTGEGRETGRPERNFRLLEKTPNENPDSAPRATALRAAARLT